MKMTPTYRLLALLLLVWSLNPSPSLLAQCADADCAPQDLTGPTITITPNAETYLIDQGSSHSAKFVVTMFDRSGIDPESLTMSCGDAQLSWTSESSTGGSYYRLNGEVILTRLGDNILTVAARDNHGNARTTTATFRVEFTDPELPIVSADAHHNQFRDTAASQLVLAYSTPSYTSMDTPRNVTLVYSSELASPNGYIQVDARPDPRTAANVVAMSMLVTGSDGKVVGREYFWQKHPTGQNQRMAVFWSMRTRPTGAYDYTVAVRSHFANGSVREKVVPARVLVVNESASRYGAGWTVGGLPRIYGAVGGIILSEGDGRLRWYKSLPCTPQLCTFERPQGDFSNLTLDRVAGIWTRIHPDNSVTKFDIHHGVVTSMTDPQGRSVTFNFQRTADAAAVPVLASITDPMQKVTAFGYTTGGYLQRITDPAGRVLSLTIDGAGDLVSFSGDRPMQVAYTSTHLPTSYTTEQGTWNPYFYRGNYSSLTAPSIKVQGSNVRPQMKFYRAEWKTTLLSAAGTGLGNLAPALASDQAVEEIADARDHRTLITKDRYNQPLTISDLTGAVTKFTYTAEGLRSSHTDADGNKTEFDWNDRGQMITERVGRFPVWQAVYESRTDLPDYEVSRGSLRWFSWGTRAQLAHTWYGQAADYERNGTTFDYDTLYRLVKMTGPKGEVREWTYDAGWGNTATDKATLEDGSVNTTSYTYDGAGRRHTTTNALGQRTITVYDARNRVREITDPLDGLTKIEYSGSRATSITDPAGKVFGFSFNALGWLESETFSGSTNPRTYSYDLDGLVVSETDRRQATVTHTYDSAHRTVTRTADNAVATFTYPDRYTVTVTNAEGSYTKKFNPAYGGLDSLRTTFAGLPGRAWELKLAIDSEDPLNPVGNDLNFYVNNVLQRSAPFRYRMNAGLEGGELAVTDPYGGVATLTFDGAAQHVRTLYPNGVIQNHTISNDGRHHGSSFTPSALQQPLGVNYQYDRVDHLTERSNSAGTMKWTYQYTPAGALQSYVQTASMPPVGCNPKVQTCNPVWSTIRSSAYSYDGVGNRTDSSSVTGNGNRYSSFNGYTLEYDLEGNLTRKAKSGFEQLLTWNSLGQLASVTTNGNVVTFGYDAAGRRVRRTAGGTSRYFLYEDDDLLLEIGANGDPIREYVYLPGTDQPLSVRENTAGVQRVYYYVLDRTGNVRALLDQAGAIVGDYAYTPYGEPIATTTGDGSAQPLRFMARELDDTSRVYYVRNRWYDPELGRFISEDPIGLSGGINPYAYANNDPINKRDPSGLQSETIVLPTLHIVGCRRGGQIVACGMWWENGTMEQWLPEWNVRSNPGDSLAASPSGRTDREEPKSGLSKTCLAASALTIAASGFGLKHVAQLAENSMMLRRTRGVVKATDEGYAELGLLNNANNPVRLTDGGRVIIANAVKAEVAEQLAGTAVGVLSKMGPWGWIGIPLVVGVGSYAICHGLS